MKVAIAGYYGFGNVGDELILTALIAQLRERPETEEITVLSASPAETSFTHNVRSVNRWNPFSVMAALWRADLFILGGGGLLQDSTSRISLLYYLGLIGFARLIRTPVFLYAMGIESLDSAWGRRLTKWAVNDEAVTITVRDSESHATLVDLGIDGRRIHVTADPVFSGASDVSAPERFPAPARTALLIPRFPCPPSGVALFRRAGQLLAASGLDVEGTLFQPSVEKPYMKKFVAAPILKPERFLSELGPAALKERIASFDWIVSARFHGLVLAALAGRPFIGIGDPDKVGRFCAACEMPYLPWDAGEGELRDALHHLSLLPITRRPRFLDTWRRAASETLSALERN